MSFDGFLKQLKSNGHNYQVIVLLAQFLFSLALYTENIGLNPYIIQYDKVRYDTNKLDKDHTRVKRSIGGSHLFLSFRSHERDFKLKLKPTSRTTFANQQVEINNINNTREIGEFLNFYEGYLIDEPNDSFASGSIIDGVFYGTINSKSHGKYFIESSKRYNHTLDAHSIIYHENDINLNKTKVNLVKRDLSKNEDENLVGCGSSSRDIKSWMKREQEALFEERRRNQGFDPFAFFDRPNLNDNYENKYSREANEKNDQKKTSHKMGKQKREASATTEAIDTATRLEFDDQRTICNLYLRVDPQLHMEIFNNEGNKDNDKTTQFLLFYLNKHVEALNSIYNSLPFFDTSKENYYIGLQFMIYRTKIITEEQCKNKTLLSDEEAKLCEPYLDVSTFLNYVSLDNFTDYCLSYTFTARDFTDGTLGLAWVAKLAGSVGGVCERRQTLQGVAKSLNSGIVTVVNYQSRVPEAVSQITFAHEVGHNFGSEHDPDDSNCSPGTNKGGNFIMYRRATTGTDRNNRNFSECSRDQMGPIVHSLVKNRAKFCFKQFSGSLCGNGIVEEGEECDCGYGTDCKESCCIDASQDTNKCKLKPGKQCSPSQGPCCDNSCSFSSNKTVCMQSNECLNNVRCTGKNATCPRFNPKYFKPDKTECNSGTQVCKAGICSGSICEKYEMEQCFLEGDLKDKKQDKAILCHLACIGAQTDNKCVDSFDIPHMNSTKGLILKPGSPCIGTLGYCDIFSKCRSVDGEGPLSRLKNFILNPVTLSSIRDWITTYWWAAALIGIGSIIFMITFIKICSVHTPSSNPRKPPALKITETLRRPIRKIPHRNTPSNSVPANSSKPNGNHRQHTHLVNEKYVKNKAKGTSNHKQTSSTSNSKSNNKKLKDQAIKTENVKIESKNNKQNLFQKKHKSNEPLHYYNNNHPLHPLPHKSNNKTDYKARKSHSEDTRQHRSKSSPEHQNNRAHTHRVEQGKRAEENKRVEKKKAKLFSKSPPPPSQPPPPNPINKKSSGAHRATSSSPSSKYANKNKYKKRSSTESSSIDA